MRQRLVARGINTVEPGADDGHAGSGAGQSAPVGRRVDAERQPADDGEPGIRQGMGEGLGVAHALRRGVAAADDAEGGLVEQAALPLAIQHGRRIRDLEQGLRIVLVRQRHQAVAGLVEPFEGGVKLRGVGFGQQGIALGGREVGRQRVASGRQNGLRRTEGREQADQAGVAHPRNEGETQPGIKCVQSGFFTVSSR